jgi:transglutaminase-like putative cysteine protease
MTRYRIHHRTTYRYGAVMAGGHSLLHLVPRTTEAQAVEGSVISSVPFADEMDTWLDGFGNVVTYLAMHHPHDVLELVAESQVAVEPHPVPHDLDLAWDQIEELLATDTTDDGLLAHACRLPSELVPAEPNLHDLVAPAFPPGRPVVEALTDLTHRIFTSFAFDPTSSDVTTPLAEVLRNGRGVCQDFAHLAIGCLRSVGLAARYVSGYLETEPPPGEVKLVGADASHAWCAAYVPGWGWLDLDPTNDLLAPDRHVTVAWGRDYRDVAPVRGVVVGPSAPQEMAVAVDVAPLDD